MLESNKEKSWLSALSFVKKLRFSVFNTTNDKQSILINKNDL